MAKQPGAASANNRPNASDDTTRNTVFGDYSDTGESGSAGKPAVKFEQVKGKDPTRKAADKKEKEISGETKPVKTARKGERPTPKEATQAANMLLTTIETVAVLATDIPEVAFTDTEFEEISEPLAALLAKLPKRVTSSAEGISAPVSLAIASYFYYKRVTALIEERRKLENASRNLGQSTVTSGGEGSG